MNYKKALRSIHLAGTVWFMLCMGYMFVLELWRAGFNWVVIFSLSGHLALLITLLVCLYLHAIFKSVGKGSNLEKEHPFTATSYYLAFYVSAPLLGVLAGAASMMGEREILPLLSGITLGTLVVTFLTWVIVDPVVSMLEMLTADSREHRLKRLSADKLQREVRRREHDALIAWLKKQQEHDQKQWQEILLPETEKLAELLKSNSADFEQAEHKAVDIGVRAWQIGGLECMRQLRDKTLELYKNRYQKITITDYISGWWDGIGNWRTPATG